MSTTVELDIPSPIRGACERMLHLTESGYLPPAFKSDIETLIEAAMAWEVWEGSLSTVECKNEK